MSLEKELEIVNAATSGPWVWEPPSEDDWPQHDQSLVTTWKGDDGHPETVILGWGYTASGIEATPQDRQFIATFNPLRVRELLLEIRRLRDQNSRLMAGNHTPAERIDWLKKFADSDDENRELRARLAAVEKRHQPEPARYYGTDLNPSRELDCKACGEGTSWPCADIRAARGE